jgi:WD40 repeat protein
MPLDPTAARVEREYKHTSPLVGCRFDPSGRFLFATAQDNSIQRFDLATGAKTTLAGHASWARGLAFRSDAPPRTADVEKAVALAAARGGAIGPAAVAAPTPPAQPFSLVSADYHGKLIWWTGAAASPTPVRTVEAHAGWCRAVAVSPDGHTLASCGNDSLVKIWDAVTGAPRRTLEGHAGHVYNVAFHPNGTRLVSADLHGVVKDWDLITGACVRDMDAKVLHKYDPTFRADIGGARGMAVAPDGRVACAGITNVSNAFAGVGNPLVVVFDWADGKPKALKPKDAFQGTAWGVGFLSDGMVIAGGGGSGGRVWFWAGAGVESTHTVTVPAHVRDMAVHPAGDRFAVACSTGSAFLYTLRPGATPPAKK